MTGPILAAIVAAAWTLPGLAFAWWATGRNGYQILHQLEMYTKQKLERALALLVVVLTAVAGVSAVLWSFDKAGYNSLLLAAVAMFLTAFVSLFVGTAFIPEYEVNGEGWLVMSREKHRIVTTEGWAGALRRMYGRT